MARSSDHRPLLKTQLSGMCRGSLVTPVHVLGVVCVIKRVDVLGSTVTLWIKVTQSQVLGNRWLLFNQKVAKGNRNQRAVMLNMA